MSHFILGVSGELQLSRCGTLARPGSVSHGDIWVAEARAEYPSMGESTASTTGGVAKHSWTWGHGPAIGTSSYRLGPPQEGPQGEGLVEGPRASGRPCRVSPGPAQQPLSSPGPGISCVIRGQAAVMGSLSCVWAPGPLLNSGKGKGPSQMQDLTHHHSQVPGHGAASLTHTPTPSTPFGMQGIGLCTKALESITVLQDGWSITFTAVVEEMHEISWNRKNTRSPTACGFSALCLIGCCAEAAAASSPAVASSVRHAVHHCSCTLIPS